MFAYRTTAHTSTGTSAFFLMFGRQPILNDFLSTQAYDTTTYQSHLQAKLAELQGFVETNLVEAATN